MKNTTGLIIAVGLGLCGALLNFAYLASRASDVDKVEFIAIRQESTVGRGEKLTEAAMMPVPIPKDCIGNLKDVGVLYQDRASVEGMAVCRTLTGGTLLLRDDTRTHPKDLELGKDETAVFIRVDGAFVSSFIQPGDMISFRVPSAAANTPTRAVALVPKVVAKPDSADAKPSDPAPKPEEPDSPIASVVAPAPAEEIGPFKVLALGARLSSPDVARAAKITQQVPETLLTIRDSKSVTGESQRVKELLNRLQVVNSRQITIRLHPRQ